MADNKQQVIYPYNHPWAIYQRKRAQYKTHLSQMPTEKLLAHTQIGTFHSGKVRVRFGTFFDKPKPARVPRATMIDQALAIFDKQYRVAYERKQEHSLDDTTMFNVWKNEPKEQNEQDK